MDTPAAAAGFVEVTKAEFFAVIGPLNVHPRSGREHTEWEMLDGSRRLVGVSVPGYANGWGPDGKTPKVFKLAPHLARRAAQA